MSEKRKHPQRPEPVKSVYKRHKGKAIDRAQVHENLFLYRFDCSAGHEGEKHDWKNQGIVNVIGGGKAFKNKCQRCDQVVYTPIH